jgi:hypothetical protein
MTDASRSYSSLITSLADNTSGAITAQALRDLVASLRHVIDSPLRPPTTPNAYDSEFAVDDAAWESWNLGSNVTRSVAGSRLILSCALAESADQLRGVVRAVPAGAFRVEATGIRPNIYHNGFFGFGFRRAGGSAPNAANVSTDKASIMSIYNAGDSDFGYIWRYLSAGGPENTYDKGGYENHGVTWTPNGIALAFDGSDTLTYYLSCDDGASWVQFASLSATTVIGGAPDSLCFCVNPLGAQNTYTTGGFNVSVDAIRRVS